jgi:hypothetical protein
MSEMPGLDNAWAVRTGRKTRYSHLRDFTNPLRMTSIGGPAAGPTEGDQWKARTPR